MKIKPLRVPSGFLIPTLLLLLFLESCQVPEAKPKIQTVTGEMVVDTSMVWLSHEHILVDFIGADSIQPAIWNRKEISKEMLPYLDALKAHNVAVFVDASPNFLGRDVPLLKKLSEQTGLKILTNTGFYGARNNKYIPDPIKTLSHEAIADIWIDEYYNGISGSTVRPGFIKISVDDTLPLKPLHQKLVKAAGLTHKATGLTIASHTGKASALWPQLEILSDIGVAPDAFIWVHAQAEPDNRELLKAAQAGCWISLDGLGWELENHIEKLQFARTNNFLDRILLSHDAGWYDPQKTKQEIQSYTSLFTSAYPRVKAMGFTDQEWKLLVAVNPGEAYHIKIRTP